MKKNFFNQISKKHLMFCCVVIYLFLFSFTYAGSTVTGTLQGHSAGSGYDYYTLVGSGANYILPGGGKTTFEGGTINGTIYTCTIVGTTDNITSADCKVKTSVVKGHLFGNTIVDINDADNLLATLPSTTVFVGGQEEDGYYLCNYTETLPNVTTATCTLNRPASPTTGKSDGYRLFPELSCQTSTQPLTCFTQALFKWAQVAIIILAVGAIVMAGLTYMTSAGNPKRIETAKKLIFGALTGVAVMILGRLFLTKVIGVSWPWF